MFFIRCTAAPREQGRRHMQSTGQTQRGLCKTLAPALPRNVFTRSRFSALAQSLPSVASAQAYPQGSLQGPNPDKLVRVAEGVCTGSSSLHFARSPSSWPFCTVSIVRVSSSGLGLNFQHRLSRCCFVGLIAFAGLRQTQHFFLHRLII